MNKILSKPIKYYVGENKPYQERLYIEWRSEDKWCITNGSSVYNRLGEWEWEPSPSNRDDKFFKRCRYTLEEAVKIVEELIKQGKLFHND